MNDTFQPADAEADALLQIFAPAVCQSAVEWNDDIPADIVAKLSPGALQVLKDCLQRLDDKEFIAEISKAALSNREKDVARNLLFGFTNKESGLRLGNMSEFTVGDRIKALYKKLGAHDHGDFFAKLLPDVYPKPLKRVADAFGLSEREEEVFSYLITGFSLKHAAAEMNLSKHTIADYLKGIYDKIDPRPSSDVAAEREDFRSRANLFLNFHAALAALQPEPETAPSGVFLHAQTVDNAASPAP